MFSIFYTQLSFLTTSFLSALGGVFPTDDCSSLEKGHLIMLSLQLNSHFALAGKKVNGISKAIKFCGGDSLPKALLDVRSCRPDQISAACLELITCSAVEAIVIYKPFWGISHLAIQGISPSWSIPQGWLATTDSTASGWDVLFFSLALTFFFFTV